MKTRKQSRNTERIEPESNRPTATVGQQIIRPIFAALAIDLLDLATFGPLGLYVGMILGAAVGFWLTPLLGFPPHRRWLSALATGVYCTLPLTGLLPLATLASLVSRSLVGGNPRVDGSHEADTAGVIDVDYEVVADEPKPAPHSERNRKSTRR